MKKTISIFLLLALLSCAVKKDKPSVISKWKLIQVETPTKVLTPKVDFLLEILEDKINFNLDMNSCFARIELRNDSIIYDMAGCTKMCCDGQLDTIASFLNYSGKYQLMKDLLIIQNTNRYTLSKMEE